LSLPASETRDVITSGTDTGNILKVLTLARATYTHVWARNAEGGGGTKQKISVKALVHTARKDHAQADAEFKHVLVCVPVIFFLPTNPRDMYKSRLRHIHDPVLLSQDRNYIFF